MSKHRATPAPRSLFEKPETYLYAAFATAGLLVGAVPADAPVTALLAALVAAPLAALALAPEPGERPSPAPRAGAPRPAPVTAPVTTPAPTAGGGGGYPLYLTDIWPRTVIPDGVPIPRRLTGNS